MTNTLKLTTISLYVFISLVVLLLTIYNNLFIVFFVGLFIASALFLGFISNRLKLNQYAAVLIPIIIMSPIIKIPGFFADLRLDDLWLIFGASVLLVKMAIKRKPIKLIYPSYAKCFTFFVLWIIVTIFISSYREPHIFSVRDWTEVYKGVKLLLYLLIAVNLKLDAVGQKKIMRVLLRSLLVLAIFGVLQYFNVANINNWLTTHYIFESKIYNLEVQRRVIGTFGNPNVFGVALMIGIAFSFASLFGEIGRESCRVRVLILECNGFGKNKEKMIRKRTIWNSIA